MGLIDTMDQIAANLEAGIEQEKKKIRKGRKGARKRSKKGSNLRKAEDTARSANPFVGGGARVADDKSATGFSFVDRSGAIRRHVDKPHRYHRVAGDMGRKPLYQYANKGRVASAPEPADPGRVDDLAAAYAGAGLSGAARSAPAVLARTAAQAVPVAGGAARAFVGDDFLGQLRDAATVANPFSDDPMAARLDQRRRGGLVDDASFLFNFANVPEITEADRVYHGGDNLLAASAGDAFGNRLIQDMLGAKVLAAAAPASRAARYEAWKANNLVRGSTGPSSYASVRRLPPENVVNPAYARPTGY